MKPEIDLGDYTSHLSTKISTEQPGFEELREFPSSFGKLAVLQTDWDSQSAYSQTTQDAHTTQLANIYRNLMN